MYWRIWIAGVLAAIASTASHAQTPSTTPVVTHHAIELNGEPLPYVATAGLMPITTPDGQTIGDMSYISYTAERDAGKTRPVAFIWNGGSGANSCAKRCLR